MVVPAAGLEGPAVVGGVEQEALLELLTGQRDADDARGRLVDAQDRAGRVGDDDRNRDRVQVADDGGRGLCGHDSRAAASDAASSTPRAALQIGRASCGEEVCKFVYVLWA